MSQLVPVRIDAAPVPARIAGAGTRHQHGMIAGFPRALARDLRVTMSGAEFEAALARSIDQIYKTSTHKV